MTMTFQQVLHIGISTIANFEENDRGMKPPVPVHISLWTTYFMLISRDKASAVSYVA